jgi:hypothetical protein
VIIRSQNKAFIINFERVDTVCLGGIEEKSVITFTDAQVVTLGTYSTEEKAIKVLDMIMEKYSDYERWNGGIINQYSIVSPFAFIPPKVFQMPQDSEV